MQVMDPQLWWQTDNHQSGLTTLGAFVASLSKGTVQPEIPGVENVLNELIADRIVLRGRKSWGRAWLASKWVSGGVLGLQGGDGVFVHRCDFGVLSNQVCRCAQAAVVDHLLDRFESVLRLNRVLRRCVRPGDIGKVMQMSDGEFDLRGLETGCRVNGEFWDGQDVE